MKKDILTPRRVGEREHEVGIELRFYGFKWCGMTPVI